MTLPFRFKEFSVSDAQCGMKISTDAVVLGAMVDVSNAESILDIGTGSGIIALMMAQKSMVPIDAVEMDADAARQAQENFIASPWSERLHLIHDSIQHFSAEANHTYDCIMSNPPYFHHQQKSNAHQTNIAKHDVGLNFEDLCGCVHTLLSEDGRFWVIIPYSEKQHFLQVFLTAGMFCTKSITLFDNKEKEPLRIIYCFAKQIQDKTEISELYIKESNASYTKEFIALTKIFYLNF